MKAKPLFSMSAVWRPVGAGSFTGTSNIINTLATDGNGNIFAGGSFTAVTAYNVAKWDGSAWTAVGSGLTGTSSVVNKLLYKNGILYAGGTFTSAGGVTLCNIAKWDGSTWTPVGSGVGANGMVRDMVAHPSDGSISIGGDFTSVDGLSSPYVAKWTGSAWTAYTGLDGSAYAVGYNGDGSYLYAGGNMWNVGHGLTRTAGTAFSQIMPLNPFPSFSQTSRLKFVLGSFYTFFVGNTVKWDGETNPTILYAGSAQDAFPITIGTRTYVCLIATPNIPGRGSAYLIEPISGAIINRISGPVCYSQTLTSGVYDPVSKYLFVGGNFTGSGQYVSESIPQKIAMCRIPGGA